MLCCARTKGSVGYIRVNRIWDPRIRDLLRGPYDVRILGVNILGSHCFWKFNFLHV